MNLLQDILGLFSRKKIISSKDLTDRDYISVAKLEAPKTPGLTVPSGQVNLLKVSDIVPGPTSRRYTALSQGLNLTIDLSKADLHIVDIGAIQVQPGFTIQLTGIPSTSTYYGVNQIAIINSANFNTTVTIANVKYPLGVAPVFSVQQDKTDMITVTGYINQEYLAVATTGF